MEKTIQDVIDIIIEAVPGAPREGSVDTFKLGDPSQKVTGIVSTFLATCEVIERAAALGANLIITHEPTFYNHLDEEDWLSDDPIYQFKRDLIERNGIAIWRFHDYWHLHKPDGIVTGLLKALGWQGYAVPGKDYICDIPPMPLGELAAFFKEKLAIPTVRVVGDPDTPCGRLGLAVGAAGGRLQIGLLRQENLDALVCGEINEWETCEYMRDEAGMRWFVAWLRPLVPDVEITFVPAGDPFSYL